MSPGKHLASGVVLGTAFLSAFGKVGPAVTAAAASIFCDLDHVIEYGVYCVKNKKKIKLSEFLSGSYFKHKGTIYIIFHAYEYLIALIVLLFIANRYKWKIRDFIAAVTAGYGLHLLLDTIGNECTLRGYFISYRMKEGCDISRICTNEKRSHTE